jgi:hypothetical protein
MTKDSAKLTYALIDFYSSLYADKYGKRPVINKHREKWAMNDVIESVGYDRSKVLLQYYFNVSSDNRHSLSWFYFNFDRLDDMLEKKIRDEERRGIMRLETKKMIEEVESR